MKERTNFYDKKSNNKIIMLIKVSAVNMSKYGADAIS